MDVWEEMAAREAKEKETNRQWEEELDRLMTIRNRPGFREKLSLGTERFFIRSLRIVGGVFIVCFALGCTGYVVDVIQKPFATLTLANLIGFIVAGFAAYLLFPGAWLCAFGEGPTQDEIRGSLLATAKENVANRLAGKK